MINKHIGEKAKQNSARKHALRYFIQLPQANIFIHNQLYTLFFINI